MFWRTITLTHFVLPEFLKCHLNPSEWLDSRSSWDCCPYQVINRHRLFRDRKAPVWVLSYSESGRTTKTLKSCNTRWVFSYRETNLNSRLFSASFWISVLVVVVLFRPVISHYSAIHLFKIKIFPLGSQSEGHHSAPVGSQGQWLTSRGHSSSWDKLMSDMMALTD